MHWEFLPFGADAPEPLPAEWNYVRFRGSGFLASKRAGDFQVVTAQFYCIVALMMATTGAYTAIQFIESVVCCLAAGGAAPQLHQFVPRQLERRAAQVATQERSGGKSISGMSVFALLAASFSMGVNSVWVMHFINTSAGMCFTFFACYGGLRLRSRFAVMQSNTEFKSATILVRRSFLYCLYLLWPSSEYRSRPVTRTAFWGNLGCPSSTSLAWAPRGRAPAC